MVAPAYFFTSTANEPVMTQITSVVNSEGPRVKTDEVREIGGAR
ncbi:hypothetical protein SAMN04489731_106352 [Amycolatopsis regifaucium]|nr:hypothetical protein SAMN04489731_106352 [Amycolatopsis regifaucium]